MYLKHLLLNVSVILMFIFGGNASAGEYIQLPGVIHVHSTFSSGKYSIGELVTRADRKGVEVLLLTDTHQAVMEYGLFPFRNLIKRREERHSVLTAGPENYLAEIERLNRQQQSVIIIPGVESTPFYYWTGSPFGKGLTAHDFHKDLLIVGMSNPDDYYKLPSLHGPVSSRYLMDLLPGFLIFLVAFVLSIYLVCQKGLLRIGGVVVAIISLALMIDHHPFKSSPFDPYHGDQGTTPYQDTIDIARSHGGLTFWAHPESNLYKNGVLVDSVKLMTAHYPESLVVSENYTGFEALYGDTITAIKAGKHWDRALLQYCMGDRAEPVWAITGSDFKEEKNGNGLDTFLTVFLVNKKGARDVLKALELGRLYGVRKAGGFRLSLDQFEIKDDVTEHRAMMGEELKSNGQPVVEGRISATDGGRYDVSVMINRGGEIIWSFEGQTPLKFSFVDNAKWSGKTFYRLDASGKTAGTLLSNPIFVKRN